MLTLLHFFMTVFVNGEQHNIALGLTVLGLLEALNLDPARVAVELDGVIVRRPDWASLALKEGSRLEIVQFVGGG